MGINKLDINKEIIEGITESEPKSKRIVFNKIGYCRLKPITDEKRLRMLNEGIQEVKEKVKKSPNKLKVKDGLTEEFAHVRFE